MLSYSIGAKNLPHHEKNNSFLVNSESNFFIWPEK